MKFIAVGTLYVCLQFNSFTFISLTVTINEKPDFQHERETFE